MKKFLIFFICLFVGIILGAFGFVWKSNQINNNTVKVKTEPRFSIETAPKNSIKGIIQSMTGTIKWESRIATETAQITQPVTIQQGEELSSEKDGSATVVFQKGLLIYLSSNSHISFVQLLPSNFVLNQLKGAIEYQKDNSIPLAVRSLHLLIQIENGDMQIIIDEKTGDINIAVKKGSVKIAFNDLQNESNVISLEKGDKYIFNDQERQGNIERNH